MPPKTMRPNLAGSHLDTYPRPAGQLLLAMIEHLVVGR